jgi:hypothetical protein
VIGIGHGVGLEADRVRDPPGEASVDEALGLLDLETLDLAGPLQVTEVREEAGSIGRDEEGRVRALEAGQVEDVCRSGDEQGLFEQPAQPVYSRVRNSSASL